MLCPTSDILPVLLVMISRGDTPHLVMKLAVSQCINFEPLKVGNYV